MNGEQRPGARLAQRPLARCGEIVALLVPMRAKCGKIRRGLESPMAPLFGNQIDELWLS